MSTINPIGGAQVGGPLGGTQQVASGAFEALSSAFLQILGGGGGEGAASGISPSADTPPPPPPTFGPFGTVQSSGLFDPSFANMASQIGQTGPEEGFSQTQSGQHGLLRDRAENVGTDANGWVSNAG